MNVGSAVGALVAIAAFAAVTFALMLLTCAPWVPALDCKASIEDCAPPMLAVKVTTLPCNTPILDSWLTVFDCNADIITLAAATLAFNELTFCSCAVALPWSAVIPALTIEILVVSCVTVAKPDPVCRPATVVCRVATFATTALTLELMLLICTP